MQQMQISSLQLFTFEEHEHAEGLSLSVEGGVLCFLKSSQEHLFFSFAERAYMLQ